MSEYKYLGQMCDEKWNALTEYEKMLMIEHLKIVHTIDIYNCTEIERKRYLKLLDWQVENNLDPCIIPAHIINETLSREGKQEELPF